jgi:hypothetical protein
MSSAASPKAGPSDPLPEGPKRDWFEWVVLAALTVLGFAVLAGLVIRTWIKGGVVTGGDGFLVVDPLQYLNWIRQSATHGAAANLYDFGPLRYTFVHPGVLLSAGFHQLGASVAASYALIKPVAIAALFFGVAPLVRQLVRGRGDRRLALVLAIFFCAPAAAIGGWTLQPWSPTKFQLDFAGGETWVGSYLWGYVFTAIAVGLVPISLLLWEKARAGNARLLVAVPACALLTSWLQPWQGATLLALIGVVELIRMRPEGRSLGLNLRQLGPVLVFGIAPLVYYFVLSKADPAWELAGKANDLPRWPVWVLIVTILPLALPAAWSYRRGHERWSSFGSVALRVWPIAAIAVYYAPLGTFPFHAIQGIQFPLAILAVLSLRDLLGGRKLGWVIPIVAVGCLVVPGTVYRVQQMRDAVKVGLQPFFLTVDEHDALRWLELNPDTGGVMTENYLGTVIPAYTGRQTWLGAGSWSPNFNTRQKLLDELFAGKLGTNAARALVVRPGAGFILEDCRATPAFFKQVEPFARVVWKQGCVSVLRVTGAPSR